MCRLGANVSGLAYSMQNTHLTAPYESSSLATPSAAGGTMGTGHFGQPVLMAAAAEKPYNRAVGPVCLFFPPVRAVVKVLSKLAPKAPTTTF